MMHERVMIAAELGSDLSANSVAEKLDFITRGPADVTTPLQRGLEVGRLWNSR